MEIKISEAKLVYSPPSNDQTNKWGVYSIPKMWREANGDLVIRFNGEEDNGFTTQCAPDLYFCSKTDGETWEIVADGENKYDLTALMGIDSPYYRCKNGDVICFKYDKSALPINDDVKPLKEYIQPCGASTIYVYPWSDIPDESKGVYFVRFKDGKEELHKIKDNFLSREVSVNAKAFDAKKNIYVDIPKNIMSNIFWTPYMSAIKELKSGKLVALAHGQHPDVFDRQCEEIYLMSSEDSGITWRKEGVVASDTEKYPFGYGGDGTECSLTHTSNGDLLCVMRMEMSTKKQYFCDTMLARSRDEGKTWSEPESVADSSVTPHIVALKDGIVVLIYGRPGVHFKVSDDNGYTWSEAYTLIGNTLTEERQRGRSDFEFKYADMKSYSNTFVEKISDDTVLVLYNDLKYLEDDGKFHKAAFVKRITVHK